MIKSSIILENHNVLLKAREVIVEGILVLKAKANGGVVVLDALGKPVITIIADGGPKIHAKNMIKLKSFTIILDQIILKSEDVEFISI